MGGAFALLVGLIVVPTTMSSGAPSGPVSFVDYAQCANGAPLSEAVADADDCIPQGWLNGILQAQNSHYSESQVTPQRALLDINTDAGTCTAGDTTGCHSITLSYQARKGTTHAYDSLATWNHTVVDANRCQGLTLTTTQLASISCNANNTPSTDTPDSTLAIVADPEEVFDAPNNEPNGSTSKVTSDHDLDGQELQMYGGTLVAMTTPAHSAPDCTNKCSDDYATTTIYYDADAGDTIQLLFGGHLSVSPLNRGGWGAGLGASNINGGPYHIKWTAADGDSIGNRDNQIMGSAIAPLAEPAISTLSSPQTAVPGIAVNLTDTVTLVGATDPTGTAHFNLKLYDTSTTPATCTTAAFTELTTNTWTKTGGGTGTGIWTASVTKSAFTFTAPGVYYWVVSVDGDANNVASGPHGCGESTEIVTVAKLTPGGATTVLLADSVTVTGTPTPTGTATFSLYKDDATCAVATSLVYGPVTVSLNSSGTASTLGAATGTATHYAATTAATYYWKVDYNGDGSYNAATIKGCKEVAAVSYPT